MKLLPMKHLNLHGKKFQIKNTSKFYEYTDKIVTLINLPRNTDKYLHQAQNNAIRFTLEKLIPTVYLYTVRLGNFFFNFMRYLCSSIKYLFSILSMYF